ncbi:sortase [Bifidobacterium bohemicum DSM 22767]|uniref:Sortase n=1 Tax=Bifidobacterium bohemicum DSM 22767 TaxID=1437606 RepID=A0A086ZHL3_9BIFI|nr:sortase [Bifidobacterium bohemicum DSM 22767]
MRDVFSRHPDEDTESIKDAEYQSMLHKPRRVMGALRIPKVSINLPIYHGTASSTLAVGAGHLYGTCLSAANPPTACSRAIVACLTPCCSPVSTNWAGATRYTYKPSAAPSGIGSPPFASSNRPTRVSTRWCQARIS